MAQTPFDFRNVIGAFEAIQTEWQQKHDALRAELEQGASTIETEKFTLVTAGHQIESLTFTTDGIGRSPVQLREELLKAYARAVVATNRRQSEAVGRILQAPALQQGMLASVPAEVRERVRDGDEEADQPQQRPDEQRPTHVVGDPATAKEGLEWAEAMEYEDPSPTPLSGDPAVLMSDVEGWSPKYHGIDPGNAQYELEQAVAALSARAPELRAAAERISVENEGKYLTVVVSGAGALTDITFTANLRRATPEAVDEEFARLYNEAVTQAAEQLHEVLRPSENQDDPSEAMLRRFEADAQRILDQFATEAGR